MPGIFEWRFPVDVSTTGRGARLPDATVRLVDALMQNRLYVGNLAADVAPSTLVELFEPHGFVMDVKLAGSDQAGESLRFALVTMAEDQSADAARKALNGASLHGLLITVEVAPQDEPHSRTPSRGEF